MEACMAFLDDYDFQLLKNESEQIVLHELERRLEELKDDEFCRCGECVVDMATMAFNAVKPMYRSSLLGSMYAAHAMDDEEYAKSVHQAVLQAVERVRANPSHD
jgi:competence protein ComFB